MKKQIGLFTAILFAVSTLMVSCSPEVHEHTFAEEWSSDETNHWHAATCEHKDEVINFEEHSFGDWTITKEPTEEAEGAREKSCTVCEYTVPEVIEKLEHTHKFESEWTYDETNHWHEATCGCSDVELQKTAHTFGDWITTKEPTEEAEGSQERVCDVCKYKETAEIAQLKHKHVAGESWKNDDKNHWKECTGCKEQLESAEHEYEWNVTKEATCTEEGTKTGTCKVCKKEVTEKIDAKGHSYSESWKNDDKNHWKECTGCKEKIESAEHEYEWTVTKEATCTEEGSKTGVCEVCKKEVTEKIDVKEHSYSGSWTKDASGHWYECVCGTKKDFEEHTYDIWKVEQKPTASTEGTSKRECKICSFEETKQIIPIPEGFVLVEAGSFQMGSNEGYSYNQPVHEVTITKPFYMGKYEVTQAEYEKHCSYTGSSSPSSSYGDGDKYPAYYVSWYDALVYCNKRSMAEGLTPCYSIDGSTDPKEWGTVPSSEDATWDSVICNWNSNGYRLPTEAEWEYAARAGDNTVDSLTYSGTSDVNELGDYAWYGSTSGNETHEVGKKLQNAYGLYDMSGNVFEWCWNWVTYSYDIEAEGGSDPTGTSAGALRVHRGGSWAINPDYCAVSCRDYNSPYVRTFNRGFRVVRPSSN